MPVEVIPSAIDPAHSASLEPESAADRHRAVAFGPDVVVAVMRAELHCVVVHHPITSVTGVPEHQQRVVGRLVEYDERTVLGVKPGLVSFFHVGTSLHFDSQLVVVVCRQLM